MAIPHDENSQLLIRCPSCGQRFRVDTELRDRTVECGACEHRFRIRDEVIVRGKKFYPGERMDTMSNRYHRVPMAVPLPEGLETVQYAAQGDASAFEPVSPLRLVAGAGAVVLVLLIAGLLFFGARTGGMLDGMPTVNRMVLGAFAATVAGGLLVFANPRARKRAILGGLGCAALLILLPLFRTDGSGTVPSVGSLADPLDPATGFPKPPDAPDPEAERIRELRDTIGTDPLERAETELREAGSGKHAYGLLLSNLAQKDKLLVRDHLSRSLGGEAYPYPRRDRYLMVLKGTDKEIDELAEFCKSLGEVAKVHREISVIEVRVDPGLFEEADLEKLTAKGTPEFYELNRSELESIDLSRVEKAVNRLKAAEPTLFRTDIARRLVALLGDDAVTFKPDVCDALLVWVDDNVKAGESAERLLEKLDKARVEIPVSLVALVARERMVDAIPVIKRLWRENSNKWEEYLVAFGGAVEGPVIKDFPAMDTVDRRAAVTVLGKVGGKDSLPLLESARQDNDTELKVRIESAEKAIRARLGQ